MHVVHADTYVAFSYKVFSRRFKQQLHQLDNLSQSSAVTRRWEPLRADWFATIGLETADERRSPLDSGHSCHASEAVWVPPAASWCNWRGVFWVVASDGLVT